MAKPMVWLPPERKGFRAFAEEHDALFTVLGALIVFFGFYMKDGVSETSKELSASIKTARNMFALRTAIGDIAHRLNSTTEILESTHSMVKDVPKVPIGLNFDMIMTSVEMMELDASANKDTFLIASDLLRSLPTSVPVLKGAETDLREHLVHKNEIKDAADQLLERLRTTRYSNISDEEKNLVIRRSYLASAMGEANLSEQGSAIESFTKHVLEEADSQKERQERRLKWATAGTYVSFFLGWAMALVGKLFDIPTLHGGSEGG
jgi:hypothetical protein